MYVDLVVLLYMDLTKDVGGAKECILCEQQKVGCAIAHPVPQTLIYSKQTLIFDENILS